MLSCVLSFSVFGQININANTTYLTCTADTVLLNAQNLDGTVLSSGSYIWEYYLQDPNTQAQQIVAITTPTPNLVIITDQDLLVVYLSAFDATGYLGGSALSFNNNQGPGISVYAVQQDCSNSCNGSYQINFDGNNTVGMLSIGAQQFLIPPYSSSLLFENVCQGDSIEFSTQDGCIPASSVIPDNFPYVSTFQVGYLSGLAGTCTNVAYVRHNSCSTPDSVAILGFMGDPFAGTYNYTIQGDSIIFSNLCEGFYSYHIYFPQGVYAYNYFEAFGGNNFMGSNLQNNPTVNYNCEGSFSLDITTQIAPYMLYYTSNGSYIFDSILVNENSYNFGLNNICEGYCSIYARPLNLSFSEIQTITHVNVSNTVTYQFPYIINNASNCNSNDGSIVFTLNNLPNNLQIFYNPNNFYSQLNIAANGELVLSNFTEGQHFIYITDNNSNLFFSQYINVGVSDTAYNPLISADITRMAGCNKCFGEILVQLDTNSISEIYNGYYYNTELIGDHAYKISGVCEGTYIIYVANSSYSLACTKNYPITLNTLELDTTLLVSVNNIEPASCNTYNSFDGSINLNSNLLQVAYNWFYENAPFYSFSDSLDIFALNSGNYDLAISNNNSCNIQTFSVPFIDSCNSFIVSTNKDFNQNCIMDEYNFIQKQLIINPGNIITNSFSVFDLPFGNYSVTPLLNPEYYCNSELNFESNSQPYYFNYSQFSFSDSSVSNDIEIFSFPGYGYSSYLGYLGTIITNNSNNLINTVLKFNKPNSMDSLQLFMYSDTLYNVPLSFSIINDTVYCNLSIQASKQIQLCAYLYNSGNTSSFVQPITFTLDYLDQNMLNNSSISDYNFFDISGWRMASNNGVMINKSVSPSNVVFSVDEDIVYTYNIKNTSDKVINKFVLIDELSNNLNPFRIVFNQNKNLNYSIKNQTLTMKSDQLNLEPNKMIQISYKIEQMANNEPGNLISSTSLYSYNNLSFKLIESENITVGLKESKSSNFNEFNVSPNPTNGMINLNFNETGGNLSVYSLLGSELQTISNISSKNLSLNLETLPKGIYILEYSNINKIIRKKLVKE